MRPGWRNLEMSLTNYVNLYKFINTNKTNNIFGQDTGKIGVIRVKVQFGQWISKYGLKERTLSIPEGAGGFYKFFKKNIVTKKTINLNISIPSNFFRKYFMAPPFDFSF